MGASLLALAKAIYYIHNVKKNNVRHEVVNAIHERSDTFCIDVGVCCNDSNESC